MFDLAVSSEQEAFAASLCARTNFGQRASGNNGTPAQQRTGITGQTVIADLLRLPRPTGDGPDGGHDFTLPGGYTLDVKTMGRTVPPRLYYVANFDADQADANADLLLFCSLNRLCATLTVCGWLPKPDFLQAAAYYPEGTRRTRFDGSSFLTKSGLYEVRLAALYAADSPRGLLHQLEEWIRDRWQETDPL